MQHLENDMDELFQRAAENYPLQEGKGDWENIEKRISDNPGSPQKIMSPVQNKRNKKFIAFSLLLFILVVGWFIFQNTQTPGTSHTGGNEITKGKENISKNSQTNNNSTIRGTEEIINSNRNDKVDNNSNDKGTLHSSVNTSVKNSTVKNMQGYSNNRVIEENNNSTNYFSIPLKEMVENRENFNSKISGLDKRMNEHIITNSLNNHLSAGTPLEEKNNNPDISEKKKKEISVALQKTKGVYIGIVAGPDFNKVRSGPFSNAGFDAGLILGFSLNRRLSFESGFMWNKKIYNSEGSNFNMDKIRTTMPTGMKINNLTSHSSLIEIPIKAKYNFILKSNSDLFVAGGVSSYIMTEETNNYNVTFNGSSDKIVGVYKKNNYGLPAVANVSIGYEHSVSKNLNIRIEPFLKIPLQGMGVGSLPVTSAGLQIGITGRLK